MTVQRKDAYNVAVVGATGAVGTEMILTLEQRDFPVAELRPLASSRSVDKTVSFKGRLLPVRELTKDSFGGIDIALFSAGGSRSKEFAPAAVQAGAVVVDNTSHFRMDPEVPLVVPEVNAEDIAWHKGIIANPNCSTIQMVAVLKPIHDAARIVRIVVATYQSTSGAGAKAVREMYDQAHAVLHDKEHAPAVFPYQIAFNCIPQIPQSGAFEPNGYTSEEMKMVYETRKMLHDERIRISATCVRVPVDRSHSEAVNVQTERKLTATEARALLAKAPGVVVVDDLGAQAYPLATMAAGKDPVYVGRIREDISQDNGLDLWIVSDNLRKGAALNAVQIAELVVGVKRPLCMVV
ncbi:MAG: aspartate-semialdehyde dehydrogenase [Verrucomicrobia bacterium]|nr:aspartate-semialdehyde dehydrogenase [Verrucomicrobiota bacterium]